ncbi:tetratricopeptide repeat protein [Actinoplanes sp. HUAS TT8]|uniref:tetratricopeptide repeat protein n=1 Tax=Actinoplanes sp. HUAS TT8 TaxID=3447453 RepID=UPI003F52041A
MTTSAYRQAQALIDIERFEQAETTLRTALAGAPGDADLLTLLAYALRRQAKVAEARDASEAALVAAPDSADAYAEHAAVLLALLRFKEAIVAAEQAVRLDPGQLLLLAQTLVADGRHAEARDAARRGLALTPHSANALVTAADVARDAGDRDEAVRLVRAGLAIDPEHRYGRWLMAMLDAERLRVRRSMRLLRDVARDNPTRPDLRSMVWPIRRLLRAARRWSLPPTVMILFLDGWAARLLAAATVLAVAGFAARLLIPAGVTPWRSLRLAPSLFRRALHAGLLTVILQAAFLCAYVVTTVPWLTIVPVALVPAQWLLAVAEDHGALRDDPRYQLALTTFRHDLRDWTAELGQWWRDTKRELRDAWREG